MGKKMHVDFFLGLTSFSYLFLFSFYCIQLSNKCYLKIIVNDRDDCAFCQKMSFCLKTRFSFIK